VKTSLKILGVAYRSFYRWKKEEAWNALKTEPITPAPSTSIEIAATDPSHMTDQPNDKLAYEQLRTEVTNLLLAENSPARNIPELKALVDEHQTLVQRQAELKALEVKLAEVLPVVGQAETQVAAAEKQLLAEKKQLASFAGELGRAVFAGFQAGELPDQPILGQRKQLQAKIDALQQQRSALLAEEKSTFLEKAKQQAQQLALAGQVKIEELKVGSSDQALGEAILGSKEKLTLKCSHSEAVLKAMVEQQRRIAEARDRRTETVNISSQRNAECATKLGRTSLSSDELKAELKELKTELSRNTKRQASIREEAIDAASRSDDALRDATLRPKLTELAKLQESIASNRPQFAKTLDSATDQFKKLPAGTRRKVLIASGVVLGLLVLGVVGRGLFSGNSSSQSMDWIKAWRANGASVKFYEKEPTVTIEEWQDGMLANLPSPKGPFSLVLNGSGITNNGLREIAKLEQLSQILLWNNDISDQGLESLSNLENLTEVSLRQTKISSDGLKHLAKLKKLKHLDLDDTNISDPGIEYLVDLNEIASLSLSGTQISDRSLTKLSSFEKLRVLSLAKTQITDSGLKAVGKVSSLKFLDLTETAITDAGLKNIEDLSQLSMLICKDTKISNRGVLKIVAKFRNLEYLDLSGTNINDVALALLGDFATETKTLESIVLFSCRRVSPEGVDALKVKAPKLSVHYYPTESLDATLQDENTSNASLGKAKTSETATEQNASAPRTPQVLNDDGNLSEATFRYTFDGKSYTGAIKQGVESDLVYYDVNDTRLSLTVSKSTSTVASFFLGVTEGHLRLGGGKDNILLQLAFSLEQQSGRGPTRRLATSREALGDDSDEVRGLVTATYLRPGPSYKTHWFGKPASSVPKDEQEMYFRNRLYPLVGFGFPFKIETSPENVRVLYADFSPKGQLAMLKDVIADPDLHFVIGDRALKIDDSARRTLYLLERAVAVLRYGQGFRDAASRPTLGD
jgi:Leucine-rich repeat (LRR) protein